MTSSVVFAQKRASLLQSFRRKKSRQKTVKQPVQRPRK